MLGRRIIKRLTSQRAWELGKALNRLRGATRNPCHFNQREQSIDKTKMNESPFLNHNDLCKFALTAALILIYVVRLQGESSTRLSEAKPASRSPRVH